MTDTADSRLQAVQHDVQRMLGACMLQLQGYELGLKGILALHRLSGPADQLAAAQSARVAEFARMTLGQLVGHLFGTYLVDNRDDMLNQSEESEPTEGSWVSISFQIGLSSDDYARTVATLRELVQLRNGLVHHFLSEHDLQSEAGCRVALESLTAARDRISDHLDELAAWANDLDRQREQVASSDTICAFVVDGVTPDGTVHWPIACIVRALREAAAALGSEAWTQLDRATGWIAVHSPHQQPARYGCRNWPQALHESAAFDMRYFAVDGRRRLYYRPRR